MQGNIRLALSLTETGTAFAAALEDKGLILAEVRGADIRRSAHRELEALRLAEANGVWMLAERRRGPPYAQPIGERQGIL